MNFIDMQFIDFMFEKRNRLDIRYSCVIMLHSYCNYYYVYYDDAAFKFQYIGVSTNNKNNSHI